MKKQSTDLMENKHYKIISPNLFKVNKNVPLKKLCNVMKNVFVS